MCLGIPMKVTVKNKNEGEAIVSGVSRKVRFDLVPGVQIGEYVIVHAGYAIQILSEEEADETMKLITDILTEEEMEAGI